MGTFVSDCAIVRANSSDDITKTLKNMLMHVHLGHNYSLLDMVRMIYTMLNFNEVYIPPT